MHNPTDRIVHITTFVTPVVEHWLEQEIAYQSEINPCQSTTGKSLYDQVFNANINVNKNVLSVLLN